MGQKISIAVMGVGLIGKRHITIIQQNKNVELSAIIDPLDTAKDYALSLHVPWYPDIKTMLSSDRPDGIIIATPNQFHVTHGLEAIAAKIPILMEKPLADNVDEGLKLVEAAEKDNVPLMVGHHRRHNIMLQTAKNIIDSGKLGQVLAAHCMFWILKPDDYFNAQWRQIKGAGPVFVNMIHDIDCLRFLLGDVKTVQAVETKQIRGFENEESCGALLHFKNGAIVTLSISDAISAPWSWELTTRENPDFPSVEQNSYYIGGTHGSLALPSLELWNYSGERTWLKPINKSVNDCPLTDPFILQLENFRKVILKKAEPLVSGREGLKTLRVIFAVKQAAQSGKIIHLP